MQRLLATDRRHRRWLISSVNLAEALQHARDWDRTTGADLVSVLSALGVEVDAPDAVTARRAAALADESNLSLADRFLLATALREAARLWTTDAVVARMARRLKLAVTRV